MYPTLDPAGTDFTVTKWNTLAQLLESMHSNVIGYGVLNGLELSAGAGLELVISSGTLNARSLSTLSSIPNYSLPASLSVYVWIREDDGNVTHTTTLVSPGTGYVCLGRPTTSGVAITGITREGRQEVLFALNEIGQVGKSSNIVCASANITMSRDQYRCRTLVLTGVLGANINLVVPNTDGFEWTVVDNTTGAFNVTIKTAAGTGILLTHTKTCQVWTDGVNVYRATADV